MTPLRDVGPGGLGVAAGLAATHRHAEEEEEEEEEEAGKFLCVERGVQDAKCENICRLQQDLLKLKKLVLKRLKFSPP